MNCTVINVDDEDSNADLSDEEKEICPICQYRLGTEIELGKMICSCTARFHYRCLIQYTRRDPEYNPFLNNRIKRVACNGIAAGIERITRNRHDDDDSNADLLDEDEEICPICQDRLGTEIELGKLNWGK
jgi:RNA polymerase subunit RPABC4/transcription elongation factor Spt4